MTCLPVHTLLRPNISPPKALLKMIFLFPRWDMLVPSMHSKRPNKLEDSKTLKSINMMHCTRQTIHCSFGGQELLDVEGKRRQGRRRCPTQLNIVLKNGKSKIWVSSKNVPTKNSDIYFLLLVRMTEIWVERT